MSGYVEVERDLECGPLFWPFPDQGSSHDTRDNEMVYALMTAGIVREYSRDNYVVITKDPIMDKNRPRVPGGKFI